MNISSSLDLLILRGWTCRRPVQPQSCLLEPGDLFACLRSGGRFCCWRVWRRCVGVGYRILWIWCQGNPNCKGQDFVVEHSSTNKDRIEKSLINDIDGTHQNRSADDIFIRSRIGLWRYISTCVHVWSEAINQKSILIPFEKIISSKKLIIIIIIIKNHKLTTLS